MAGYRGPALFGPPAVEAIGFYSGGVPRLINVLCRDALVAAHRTGQPLVSPDIIVESARALHIGPAFDFTPSQPHVPDAPPPSPATPVPEPVRHGGETAPATRTGRHRHHCTNCGTHWSHLEPCAAQWQVALPSCPTCGTTPQRSPGRVRLGARPASRRGLLVGAAGGIAAITLVTFHFLPVNPGGGRATAPPPRVAVAPTLPPTERVTSPPPQIVLAPPSETPSSAPAESKPPGDTAARGMPDERETRARDRWTRDTWRCTRALRTRRAWTRALTIREPASHGRARSAAPRCPAHPLPLRRPQTCGRQSKPLTPRGRRASPPPDSFLRCRSLPLSRIHRSDSSEPRVRLARPRRCPGASCLRPRRPPWPPRHPLPLRRPQTCGRQSQPLTPHGRRASPPPDSFLHRRSPPLSRIHRSDWSERRVQLARPWRCPGASCLRPRRPPWRHRLVRGARCPNRPAIVCRSRRQERVAHRCRPAPRRRPDQPRGPGRVAPRQCLYRI